MSARHWTRTLALLALAGNAALAQEASAPTSQPNGREQVLRMNAAGQFEIHLRNVALQDALRMLSLQAQRNITISQSVAAQVTTDLYGVSFEEALEGLTTPSGFTWFVQGKFVYVCKPEEREAVVNANRPTELRLIELKYIAAGEVIPVISKLLSPRGSISNTPDPKVPGVALNAEAFDDALAAGLGGKSKAIGDFLLVRDFAENLEEIEQVIAKMDARPRQVLIEAVIMRARLNEKNALGVDFNVLAGVDFQTLSATSTGGTNITVGDVPSAAFENNIAAVDTKFAANVPAGGLSFGLITNNVAAFVRALEETVDLTIVANPKVLAVNEQPARVIVGRQDGYLTTTVTQTSTVQSVEFLETGTQILFRPFIGSDGFIRMDIHPEDSSGGLTPTNLPYKDTTEVSSNVLVKDGHTLVIGGLFRELTATNKSQVPWFGNIPIAGLLASSTNDNAIREEVIVLITPHIVDPERDSAISAAAMDEVERCRVLAHRGLLPWGRERLAQAHYAWAVEHERAGKRNAALWDLQLALWLNPQFIEADRLREKLDDRTTAEPDNSIIHDIVRQMIEQDCASPGGTGRNSPGAPPPAAVEEQDGMTIRSLNINAEPSSTPE